MRSLACLLSLLWSSPALAGDLSVQVRGPNGAAVAGAVVTVHLVGRPTPAPRAAATQNVDQKNIQFHPFILIVPQNTSVAFPNLDPVRHHVYSFSQTKKFELKLFAREQNRTIKFDKNGIVPLGCNIHDQMSAFINVVDTPWAVQTDARGNAVLGGLPAGAVSVTVWHPYLRAPGNQMSRASTAGARESFVVALRTPPRAVGASAY